MSYVKHIKTSNKAYLNVALTWREVSKGETVMDVIRGATEIGAKEAVKTL
jgi:hypothetical protein